MISDKQKMILAFPYSKYEALICDGAVRSGKTSVMMIAFVDWAMREFDRQFFIIGGNTMNGVLRNVIEPYMALAYARRRYSLRWHSGKNRLEVTRGAKTNYFYVFGGGNNGAFAQVQGLTAAGCFIDEVAICSRSFVEQCLARCSLEGSRFWFNCNPANPEHWFRMEWLLQLERHNALHIHFTIYDNPSLSPELVHRYETMYSGVFHRRYILGEWAVADGLVYDFFNRETMCKELDIDSLNVQQRRTMRYYVSVDYGIAHPFVALMWVIVDGKAYCVDEFSYKARETGFQKTDEELYADMDRWIGGKTIMEVIVDPSAMSFKEVIYRHGKYSYLNADNDVLNGISRTMTGLKAGMVLISKKCRTLLEEIGLYSWNDNAKFDSVIKENDHACDAMRYFVNTIAVRNVKGYWNY